MLRNATSMFFILEPPPVRIMPPSNLSIYSLGICEYTFSTISCVRASTISINFLQSTLRSLSIGYFLLLSISLLSVKALPYSSFIFSASFSSICSEAISFVILLPPRGITARWRRMFFEYTDTVVVSAPRSTNKHPERFSAGVSTLSARAKGARYISAMAIPALSKHLLSLR